MLGEVFSKEFIRQFITDKRKALGISQGKFAEIIFDDNEKRSWVSDIENGRKSIDPDTFGKVLKNLNCEFRIIEL